MLEYAFYASVVGVTTNFMFNLRALSCALIAFPIFGKFLTNRSHLLLAKSSVRNKPCFQVTEAATKTKIPYCVRQICRSDVHA